MPFLRIDPLSSLIKVDIVCKNDLKSQADDKADNIFVTGSLRFKPESSKKYRKTSITWLPKARAQLWQLKNTNISG